MKSIDSILMKNVADSFYFTGIKIIGKDENKELDNFIIYEYSYIVNMSFACELYLKLINYKNGLEITGHCIKDLYSNLKTDIKKELEIENIELVLDEINNNYVDWRYGFEKENVESNISGLRMFAEKLHNYCNKNI